MEVELPLREIMYLGDEINQKGILIQIATKKEIKRKILSRRLHAGLRLEILKLLIPQSANLVSAKRAFTR
jgi:hypothetical protein